MTQSIEIYKTSQGTEIQVKLDNQTVWLEAQMIAQLFGVQRPAIVKHIRNIYKTNELYEVSTCSILEQVAADGKKRKMNFYNLDMIISIGFRVNSIQATLFRQWATQRLKDYLVQGYAINEKRLAEKQMRFETLKTGIQILSRVIERQATEEDSEILKVFAKGLELLNDYDNEQLDAKGKTQKTAVLTSKEEYLEVIRQMRSDLSSEIFALPKDQSFDSSIAQIGQSFNGHELYPGIEEKAATILYLIVKNHSFVDGNKRIAAACFLYFLAKNNLLFDENNQPVISNEAVAALTLFAASSKPEEMNTIKNLIISILNRR